MQGLGVPAFLFNSKKPKCNKCMSMLIPTSCFFFGASLCGCNVTEALSNVTEALDVIVSTAQL